MLKECNGTIASLIARSSPSGFRTTLPENVRPTVAYFAHVPLEHNRLSFTLCYDSCNAGIITVFAISQIYISKSFDTRALYISNRLQIRASLLRVTVLHQRNWHVVRRLTLTVLQHQNCSNSLFINFFSISIAQVHDLILKKINETYSHKFFHSAICLLNRD